jgi:hypothetical protein
VRPVAFIIKKKLLDHGQLAATAEVARMSTYRRVSCKNVYSSLNLVSHHVMYWVISIDVFARL